MTAPSLARLALRQLRSAQGDVLKAVEELDEDQLRWRPEHGPQSIAWHVWHMARWDDYMLERLGGEGVWEPEGVQSRWGWPEGIELGEEEAGTGLDDNLAEALSFPPKAQLLEYVKAVFERSQRHVASLSDEYLAESWEEGGRATKADAVFGFAGHDYQHGGMIAAIKGLLGLRGTPD